MSCSKCNDTGVWETGNNDLPCDCPAGDTALFNTAGVAGPVSGAEIRRHYLNDSPEPLPSGMRPPMGPHPEGYHYTEEARKRCYACSDSADEARARQLIADGFYSTSNKYRHVERVHVPHFAVAVSFDPSVPVWLRDKMREWYDRGVRGGWCRENLGEVLELTVGEYYAFRRLGGRSA